jgi:hypothetical protein
MLKRVAMFVLLLTVAFGATAQEQNEKKESKFWFSAGADFASNYMWRGYDQSYTGNMFDPSVQYGVTLGYGRFFLDLWANNSLMSTYNAFDMTIGYEHKGLRITVYDVYCGLTKEMPHFFDKDTHNLTATIDYTFFDRLRLHWGTTFIHSSDFIEKEDGTRRRAFSSYFEVSYTQPILLFFDLEITAGASPWTGPFWCAGPRVMQLDGSYALDFDNIPTGFNVTNLSLAIKKDFDLRICEIPVSLGYTYNPTTNRHYALLKAGIWF